MTNTYPIRFPGQLRQHLQALRKKRGLTQADVAALIGVSQARIAEIEANPGVVSFEQLMKLLSAVGVTVILSESLEDHLSTNTNAQEKNTAIDSISENAEALRKILKSMDPTHNILEESGNAKESWTKPIESYPSQRSVSKAIGKLSNTEALNKIIESLGGEELVRKAIKDNGSSEALRRALESLGGNELVRKLIEEKNKKDLLDKYWPSEFDSYRKRLNFSKKGNW